MPKEGYPMNERLRKLLEQRANVWSQMQEIRDRYKDTADPLSGEDEQAWQRAESDLEKLSKDIEREERASKFDADMSRVEPPIITTDDTRDDGQEKDAQAEYREAFLSWVRNGNEGLDNEQRNMLATGRVAGEELRALGVGTNSAGGYTVDPQFRAQLIEQMKAYGSVRSVASVWTTDTGATLTWPTLDDTSNVGAILAENTQISQQDLAFGTATLSAYKYTSKAVLMSWELLQDSAVDAEGVVTSALGVRLGRITNQHYTTGTGSSQPTGIVTGATAGVTLATGNTTSITPDGLIDLIHSVDPAYRNPSNQFMLPDATVATIRKLKDSNNLPLWQPSTQAGVPSTLLGYGYVVNNDMAVPAANVKSILFGDFKAGYAIRDVKSMQMIRLNERYADYLQTGFFAFLRTDATTINASAYKALKQSAT